MLTQNLENQPFFTDKRYKKPKSGEEKNSFLRRFILFNEKIRAEIPDPQARIVAAHASWNNYEVLADLSVRFADNQHFLFFNNKDHHEAHPSSFERACLAFDRRLAKAQKAKQLKGRN